MEFRVADATSRTMLATIVAKSKRSQVPFAPGFFRRDDPQDPPPILARMLRGGRGGEVRLKVYMSMQLIGVKKPHDVTRQPASWASLLSLDDPSRNGARRVDDAIKWLETNKLIRTEKRRGGPATVILLDQLGTGEPYVRPSTRYLNIPVAFWENWWIVSLSASAIAMWMVVTDMQAGKPLPKWIVPEEARERYDLSPDTWTKGTRELAAHGLLKIGRAPQGNDFIWDRLRNTYARNLDRLDETPLTL